MGLFRVSRSTNVLLPTMCCRATLEGEGATAGSLCDTMKAGVVGVVFCGPRGAFAAAALGVDAMSLPTLRLAS